MALLTPDQLVTADRYEIGLDHLARTIERLNTLGRQLGLPPIPHLPYFTASSTFNQRMQRHYLAAIEQQAQARRELLERQAA